MLEAERHCLGLQLNDVALDHAVVEEDRLVLALEPGQLQDALRIVHQPLAKESHCTIERLITLEQSETPQEVFRIVDIYIR